MHNTTRVSIIVTLAFSAVGCVANPGEIAELQEEQQAAADEAFAGFAEAAPAPSTAVVEIGDIGHTGRLRARSFKSYQIVIPANATLSITAQSDVASTVGIEVRGRLRRGQAVPRTVLAQGSAKSPRAGQPAVLRRTFPRAGVYQVRFNTAGAGDIRFAISSAGGATKIGCTTDDRVVGEDPSCPSLSDCTPKDGSAVCAIYGNTDRGVSACTADSDCFGRGFCRVGLCHAFAGDGAACGGHVPASFQERCDDAIGYCLDRDPRIADEPGICGFGDVVFTTLQELDNIDQGRIVSLVDAISPSNFEQDGGITYLTMQYSAADDVCTLVNSRGVQLLTLDAATGETPSACTGPAKRVRVLGVWNHERGAETYSFDAISIAPVN